MNKLQTFIIRISGKITSFIFCVLLICPLASSAQKDLFFFGGAELAGSTYRYKTAQRGSILHKGIWDTGGSEGTSGELVLNTGLHYRISNQFALEGGFAVSEIDLAVYDTKYKNTHKATWEFPGNYNKPVAGDGSFEYAHIYSAPYASFYYFPGGRHFYLNPGVQFNYNAQSAHTSMTTYSSDGQAPTLNAHFAPRYVAGFLEAGFYFDSSDQRTFEDQKRETVRYFVGLRYYQAGKMMDADYQNTYKNSVLSTDHVSASGSYISLTFRMGIQIPGVGAHSFPGSKAAFRSEHRKGRPKHVKMEQAKKAAMKRAAQKKEETEKNTALSQQTQPNRDTQKSLKPTHVHLKKAKKIIRTPRYRH